MDKLEVVRLAVRALGDVSAQELALFIERHHGFTIAPMYLPIYLASIRDQQRLEAARQAARVAAEQEQPQRPDLGKVAARSQCGEDARQLALQLMAKHGLHAWSFDFNRRKRSMGLCVYQRQTIELSIHFVERDNPATEIQDTILHEIAHALVGPGHGHNRVWKKKCIEVGARPQRCGQADMPAGKWQARCGGCGKMFHRHRKPKRPQGWWCRTCGPETGRLLWREDSAPDGNRARAG